MPTSSGISQAQPRKRLGRNLFPEVFERRCGPVAGEAWPTAEHGALGAARGAFLRSWRLLAIDGFEVDLPDSSQNAPEFGYAGSGENRSAFPKARVVALSESRTVRDHAVRGRPPGDVCPAQRVVAVHAVRGRSSMSRLPVPTSCPLRAHLRRRVSSRLGGTMTLGCSPCLESASPLRSADRCRSSRRARAARGRDAPMTAKQTWVDGRVKVLQAALHELGLSASRLAATDLIRERVHWALSQLGISPAAARRDLTDEAVQELAARWPSPSCKRRPAPTSSTPRTTALPLTLVDRCVAGLAEASRIRLYEADDIDHVRVSVSQIAQALSAIGQITATAPNHRHGSRLRAVGPDELPAPVRDQISRAVVADAVEALARLRTPYWLGDTGVHLHALASLLTQAHEMLPEAIADARDQGLTWTEIGQLLGLSAERPQHAATDPISDLLDRDHPHKCR